MGERPILKGNPRAFARFRGGPPLVFPLSLLNTAKVLHMVAK